MATVYVDIPITALVPASTNGAQFGVAANGTRYLAFDGGSTDETAVVQLENLPSYVGSPVIEFIWGAASATTGNVVWGVQAAAQTPNADTEAADSYSLDTASTIQDAHLGTTASRRHQCQTSIANPDGLAANDSLVLSIYRDASDTTNDTLAGDAWLFGLRLSYSDA
jgi:hypothetical protein